MQRLSLATDAEYYCIISQNRRIGFYAKSSPFWYWTNGSDDHIVRQALELVSLNPLVLDKRF